MKTCVIDATMAGRGTRSKIGTIESKITEIAWKMLVIAARIYATDAKTSVND